MEPIKTHALFTDEERNICLLFGNNYIGIYPSYCTQDDGKVVQVLTFQELSEPCDPEKPETRKPRTDLPSVNLMFKDSEGLQTVIDNLKFLLGKSKAVEILDEKMEDQALPVRALNVLREAEIETVRDLVRYKRTDLLKYRNFGKVSLRMIDEWLEKHGLQFGLDV